MNEEFENMRGDKLGELSEELLLERQENFPRGNIPDAGDTPGDIAYQESVSGSQQIPGTMTQGVEVTSVYDARPINARDFLVSGTDTMTPGNGGAEKRIASFEYTVPQGFIGILRAFRYEVDLVVPTPTLNFFLTTLFINDSPVDDYVQIGLGQTVNNFIPTYLVAEPGSIFKIELTLGSAVPSLTANKTLLMFLYGNNLLSRGLPARLEPGNKTISKPIEY